MSLSTAPEEAALSPQLTGEGRRARFLKRMRPARCGPNAGYSRGELHVFVFDDPERWTGCP